MARRIERREYPRVKKLDRREFQRVIVKLETAIQTKKKYQLSGWTRDVSVKGVYVLCDGLLPLGARVKCRICLGDIRKGAPSIETDGRVVRCDETGVAVQFRPIAVECFKKLTSFFGS